MKKALFTILITLSCLNAGLKGQVINSPDTTLKIINAEYLNKDLPNRVNYPRKAIDNNIEGDVILSLVIDKNGKLDSMDIVSSPNLILSTSSIVSINEEDSKWSPCKINGEPIDKKYLFIFRYRLYLDTPPTDFKEIANGYFDKQKYEKALKYYDKAIKENRYDYKLFEARSKTKGFLGDINGSSKDLQECVKLQNEVISIVNINLTVVKRVITKRTMIRDTRIGY